LLTCDLCFCRSISLPPHSYHWISLCKQRSHPPNHNRSDRSRLLIIILLFLATFGSGSGMQRSHSNRSYEASSMITFLHGWPHYTKSFVRYDPHPRLVVEDPGNCSFIHFFTLVDASHLYPSLCISTHIETWGETIQVFAIFISLLSCIYLVTPPHDPSLSIFCLFITSICYVICLIDG
jgi:hypothetical protein